MTNQYYLIVDWGKQKIMESLTADNMKDAHRFSSPKYNLGKKSQYLLFKEIKT